MTNLVISDIHSNMEALESVLNSAKEIGYDRIVCLGDVVGYGPNPNEVVEWVIENDDGNNIFIAGNHDLACAYDDYNIDNYFDHSRISTYKTREILLQQNKDYLKTFAQEFKIVDDVYYSHSNPLPNNLYDSYVRSDRETFPIFKWLQEKNLKCCFVGHTHVQSFWQNDGRIIFNPGSVGQPRDGNPKASFMIFDDQTYKFTYHRSEYDVKKTQDKMFDWLSKSFTIIEHLRYEYTIDRLGKGR